MTNDGIGTEHDRSQLRGGPFVNIETYIERMRDEHGDERADALAATLLRMDQSEAKRRNPRRKHSPELRNAPDQWSRLRAANPNDPAFHLPPVGEVPTAPSTSVADWMASGIYLLEWINTEDRYIGESICIGGRVGSHLGALATGTHINRRLQDAYSRHGAAGLQVRVLETCEPKVLRLRELQWIAHLSPRLNIGEGGCHL